jgi:cobalt-zinc-cadmium efflux system membrane fusion protein
MDTRKYIIGGLILVGAVVATYFGTKHFSQSALITEEAGHEDEDGHGHGSGMKTVELNQAQFKNAGIELGWFEKKNLSEVVNANGYTKLPPQNQAAVSVFTTGLVKNIKVIEGQEVKKGEVLATIESPEFTILQQDYLIAKSNLEYLELEHARQTSLSQADASAKKVLEKTTSELEMAQARYNSLKKQLGIFGINGEGSTASTINVRAPISGHITDIMVNMGATVEVGKPLFHIVDNSEMHVDLLVYEKDLFKVKEGQNVRFVLTNQSNKEINGTIFNIGKSFENETKTVAVHAHIQDKEKELIPGMYVNALIDVGTNKVRTLPEAAVIEAEGRSFIFTYKKDDGQSHGGHGHGMTFKRVEVQTGPSQLGFIEVTPVQKISEGSKIVVEGSYYLQSHLQKSESGGEHSH